MLKIILRGIIMLICSVLSLTAQPSEDEKLITLGKAYKDYMFQKEPTKEFIQSLKANVPNGLQEATEFIVQTITTKNKLLSPVYLTRPSDQVLKQIYIARRLDLNMREENPIDNFILLDSLKKKQVLTYELVDNYYSMLFGAISNKNKPFDLSKVNFKLSEYNFKDDTERGIFFLHCMRDCGMQIWGFINIPKPPNTKEAYKYINRFPKFNGQPYYYYNDFNFKDFEMVIITDEGMQSYKAFYLDKYYETLLNHLITLNKEKRPEKEVHDLLLGSILRERSLYKYSKYKDVLERLFTEVKTD